MKYFVINNQHSRLANFENGICESSEIDNIPNLNYLLVSTPTLIKIDFKTNESNKLFKSINDDYFNYKNREYLLKSGTILDLFYINYFNLNKDNFIQLKIITEEVKKEELNEIKEIKINQEEIITEEVKRRGRPPKNEIII